MILLLRSLFIIVLVTYYYYGFVEFLVILRCCCYWQVCGSLLAIQVVISNYYGYSLSLLCLINCLLSISCSRYVLYPRYDLTTALFASQPDAQDNIGDTALHLACRKGFKIGVQLLLERVCCLVLIFFILSYLVLLLLHLSCILSCLGTLHCCGMDGVFLS